MRIRRYLSYANVIATLALVFSLAGGAYAITRVNSHDIVNGSIKSIDLRNGKGVKAADVKRDSLADKQINERKLNASAFAPVAGNEASDCDPSSSSFVNCARATLQLRARSRVIVVATGNEESVSGAARAVCEVRIDNRPESVSANPGEETTDNTSGAATNGFARTVVTQRLLSRGKHKVALACSQLSGDARIDAPTIAAIAIGSH